MSKLWFTSDTHFNAQRTLILSKRPFDNVQEMNEAMVQNWNKVVGKEDKVYHLGDFGDYDFIRELNGKVMLILGNYEEKDLENYDSFEDFKSFLLSKGFYDVIPRESYYLGDIGLIHLTHKPSDCLPGVFNLFGHVHKLSLVKTFGLNVGVDCHNFYPIDIETISAYKVGIKQYYDEEVFMQSLPERIRGRK